MNIDWKHFSTIAFIDSNVALECLALEQLPWWEINKTGPILVLITSTVLQEVDSKKNNARLGDHARRFNRTMRPLLADQMTVMIRPSPAPLVELALADCGRIDWEQYTDLDPDEPDSRVVAQALTARGPPQENRIVVSQDIRPLHLARQYGMRTYHIGENWLRPKERSESEKKVGSLTREIEAMKNRQPKLVFSFKANKSITSVHQIRQLSGEERQKIQDTIIRLYPMSEQNRNLSLIINPFNDYDYTLSERYKNWEEKIIPQFVSEYEDKIELNFGQIEIIFRIENNGQVPAESLLINLSVQGGWLNPQFVFARPSGPAAPRIRERNFMPSNFHGLSIRPAASFGKHEFVVLKKPKRSTEIQIACDDFRHGYDYEYRMIGWIDPRADKFFIDAVVTAANLYGEIKNTFSIMKLVTESSVYDLINPETLNFRQPPEIVDLLNVAVNENNFMDFEFDGSGWDK